jgi:hypothetical protein
MRAFTVLLLLAGCGPTLITDKGLSRSCSVNADCVPVFFGDVCSTCACPNDAIASSSKSRYDNDLASIQKWCGPRPPIACECVTATAVCTNGSCTASR